MQNYLPSSLQHRVENDKSFLEEQFFLRICNKHKKREFDPPVKLPRQTAVWFQAYHVRKKQLGSNT